MASHGRRRSGPKAEHGPGSGAKSALLRRCAERIKADRAEAVRMARRLGALGSDDDTARAQKRMVLESLLQQAAETPDEMVLLEEEEETSVLVQELHDCILALVEQEHAEQVEADEEDLVDALAELDFDDFSATDKCLCPKCEKRQLLRNRGVFYCRCGFRVQTNAADAISLAMISQRLASSLQAHADRGCYGKVDIAVERCLSCELLVASCAVCDHKEVVI